MMFNKADQQWICTNPLELVTGMKMAHLLMLEKVSSIIAGTVLLYERKDCWIMFQTSDIIKLHLTEKESGVDFEKGSCIRLNRATLKWESFDLDYLPPFSECRLPTIGELEIYNNLCNL